MTRDARILKPTIYSVSHQDMLDIWVEFMHPEDNIVVIWDGRKHLDILKKSGFILDVASLFDNKVITISLNDVRDCFYVMDVVSSYENHPYIQIYTDGKMLTDNLENLREEITI